MDVTPATGAPGSLQTAAALIPVAKPKTPFEAVIAATTPEERRLLHLAAFGVPPPSATSQRVPTSLSAVDVLVNAVTGSGTSVDRASVERASFAFKGGRLLDPPQAQQQAGVVVPDALVCLAAHDTKCKVPLNDPRSQTAAFTAACAYVSQWVPGQEASQWSVQAVPLDD